jgi:hypothetical protein
VYNNEGLRPRLAAAVPPALSNRAKSKLALRAKKDSREEQRSVPIERSTLRVIWLLAPDPFSDQKSVATSST